NVDHVALEGGEGGSTGAAGVDGGGDAAAQAVGVGLDAQRGAAPEDVRVQVDPAGRDDQAAGVDDVTVDALAHEVGADFGNTSAADADVGKTIEVLARVDDPTAAYDHVEHGSKHRTRYTRRGPRGQTVPMGGSRFLAVPLRGAKRNGFPGGRPA